METHTHNERFLIEMLLEMSIIFSTSLLSFLPVTTGCCFTCCNESMLLLFVVML